MTPKKIQHVLAAAEALIKYRDRTYNQVSSFGAVFDEPDRGIFTNSESGPCHASIADFGDCSGCDYVGYYEENRPGDSDPVALYSWSKGPTADPAFQKWNEWLLGPKSPYQRLWQDHDKNPVFNGLHVFGDEFCTRYGYILTDLDQPSNLIVNFMIMARQPNEHAAILPTWSEMTGLGVDPSLAALLSHSVRHSAGVWYFDNLVPHSAFDGVKHVTPAYVSNFCLGHPTRPTEPYNKDKRYQPCNAVFEAKGVDFPDNQNNSYLKYLIKTYEAASGAVMPKRMFNTSQPKTLALTDENFLKVMEQEKARIYGNTKK